MVAEDRPPCLIIYSYVQSLQRRLSELEGRETTSLNRPTQSEALDNADVGNVVSEVDSAQPQTTSPINATVGSSPDDHDGQHYPADAQPIQTDRVSNSEPGHSRCTNPSPLSSHNGRRQAQSWHGRDTSSAYSPPEPMNPVDLSDDLEHFVYQSSIRPEALPAKVEEHLVEVYFTHANRKYPFLLQSTFCAWHRNWKMRTINDASPDLWQGFMVHMVRPCFRGDFCLMVVSFSQSACS